MSEHDKAVARLLSKPADFSWSELVTLMTALGYELRTTGGSRRKFLDPATGKTHAMHEPHPSGMLKSYQVRQVIQFLREEGKVP
jgi:HicA toxin of bacterial toxin-antitoxin,